MNPYAPHKTVSLLLVAMLLSLAFNPGLGVSVQATTLEDILYVRLGGSVIDDCSSWADACELQDALGMAASGDEIWVAQGIYTPGPAGNREATFQLVNGVRIYGGFPAQGEPAFEDRDWQVNPTILSGDIDGVVGPEGNAYRVVSAVNLPGGATLDGFTITGANNNRPTHPAQWGGGLYVESIDSYLVIQHVRFEGNSAAAGGGMFTNGGGSQVVLEEVIFHQNTATINGGGLHTYLGSHPTLTNVTFSANSATDGNGGGMINYSSSNPTLTNVTFTGNSAAEGGGLYNHDQSSPTLTNVTFTGNSATNNGGGMFNNTSSNPTLTNTILWGNTATSAGPQIYNTGGSAPVVTYSDVQGGYGAPEDHNIDADPWFVHATSGNLRLQADSPAIDAGSNAALTPGVTTDRDGSPRVVDFPGVHDPGVIVDMGAYEAQFGTETIFVDRDAPGPVHDGSSWSQAFTHLQSALAASHGGNQVWVAQGVYTPGPAGNRLATFQLKEDVALYGGFAGTESAREQRDWVANPTILSGDIDHNDLTLNGVVTDTLNMFGLNAYHVVTAVGITGTAMLDGFTITAGLDGGGMYNWESSPTLANLTFTGNSASVGGGIYIRSNSHPTLTNVIFSNNSASLGGAMYNYSSSPTLTNVSFSGNSADNGGGMFNQNSSPTITDVTFTENSADSDGGGMSNWNSSPTLTNVTFTGNSSDWYSGGMANHNSSPTLTNVTFTGNSAVAGGGIYNNNSSPTLTNVTFTGNSADHSGGGMYNLSSSNPTLTNVTFTGNSAGIGGGMCNQTSNPTLTNLILWGNTASSAGPQIYNTDGSAPVVTYSDVQGGYGGPADHNIDADPVLGPLADNGGFTLTHALGDGSPAIDAGDPETCPPTDQRGRPRPADGNGDGVALCDMGAYEFYGVLYLYLPLAVR